MQITKELRAKIDRLYTAKKEELNTIKTEKLKVVIDQEVAALMAELKKIPEDSVLMTALKREYCSRRLSIDPSLQNLAENLSSARYHSVEGRAIENECAEAKATLDLEKERFLIELSYAGGMNELREVFERFNFAF